VRLLLTAATTPLAATTPTFASGARRAGVLMLRRPILVSVRS
jgi:hypothetical protein